MEILNNRVGRENERTTLCPFKVQNFSDLLVLDHVDFI